MADSKQYRFTGFYPTNYCPDPHEGGRWIVPGEVVSWSEPPDGNWAQVEGSDESHGDKQVFPGASTFPSAHEHQGDSAETSETKPED